ncbi:MAG: glycine cleavage system protein T [Chloroflexi bacterium]|nr:glycine cleavage system protein T [Chloroflexota bacterium]
MTMMPTSQSDPVVYHAAHDTAVVVDHHATGVLQFSGSSRLDLLHRMSTQAVKGLAAGQGAATILTTDIGRIIDRLRLYASGDAVTVLTGENNADFIARYLLRFVFFNDDFRLQDISAATAVFGVYGPQAGQKLVNAGLPEADLPLHHWLPANVDGVPLSLHRTDPIAGDGYLVLAAAADKAAVQARLLAAGLTTADEATAEYLRIESGIPRLGRELTQDYIPLEADLWSDVSFNKGCYIGQEIIARLESRGKLAKRLVKLGLTAPAEPGSDITAAGKKVGTLTSLGSGPAGLVGLGYVKTAVLNENQALWIGDTAVTLR